jgi:hypothetical protein
MIHNLTISRRNFFIIAALLKLFVNEEVLRRERLLGVNDVVTVPDLFEDRFILVFVLLRALFAISTRLLWRTLCLETLASLTDILDQLILLFVGQVASVVVSA